MVVAGGRLLAGGWGMCGAEGVEGMTTQGAHCGGQLGDI